MGERDVRERMKRGRSDVNRPVALFENERMVDKREKKRDERQVWCDRKWTHDTNGDDEPARRTNPSQHNTRIYRREERETERERWYHPRWYHLDKGSREMISEENEQERDEMNEQGKKEKRKCRGPVTDPFYSEPYTCRPPSVQLI